MSTESTRSAGLRAAVTVAIALLAVAPVQAESWLDPVRALDSQGRTREALERLETDLARRGSEPEAELLEGVLLAKLGRTPEARERFRRLIREHPDRPEAYNNLAVMHAAAGDYDAAIEILKQGLGTHPSYRTAYDNLSKVYGKLASEAYSKALGDERIDAEPLRLALISGLGSELPAAAAAPVQSAAGPPPPLVRPEPAAPPPVPVERPRAAVAAGGDQEPAPAAVASAPADDAQAVWEVVEAWAEAWARQRVDSYLSFYAPGFEPAGGLSRSSWEGLRRQRLSSPSYIRISLALLGVERPAPDRAVVRFVQSYESDRFGDTVTKSLELVRTDGDWRIVSETIEEVGA